MSKKKKADELPPKVRKRGNGYTYRYSIPITNPDGTIGRKQKETIAYPTPLEAYQAGVLIEAKLIEGTYVDEKNILFTDWADRGVELHSAIKKLKQNTIDVMRSNLKYARKTFAGRKLKDITPDIYQDYLLNLKKVHKLGESAIKGAHSAMRTLFKLAVKRELIARDVTEGADLPVFKPTFEQLELDDEPLPEYLEKEQLAALLRTAKEQAEKEENPVKAFGARQHFRIIYVLAHTGLRIGELCALEKTRINKQANTIRIIANLYRRMGIANFKLEPPKNKTSIRTVDVSKSVMAVLDAQVHDLKVFRLQTGAKFYNKREFAFVSFKRYPGYPLDPATFNADLAESLAAAGLPSSITPHSLRHTFTSLSAEAGNTLEDIQKQLGHANDKLTKRVYLHVTEARRKANVDKLDNLLKDLLNGLN